MGTMVVGDTNTAQRVNNTLMAKEVTLYLCNDNQSATRLLLGTPCYCWQKLLTSHCGHRKHAAKA